MTQSTQSTNTATSNTTQNYAGFQAPALQTAFDAAGTALGQAQNAPTPTDFTAQFTPQMMQAFQNELGYGSNAGANPVVNATNGASTALSNAGSNAAAQGLYGLQNFTPAGGTQSNINAANAYAAADAPNIQGAVQQGMLAANQNYSDVQAPAIQRNAAGTGNINSTAPSISQGILQRGLAEQAATMGSSLSNADYQNALNLANTQSNQQNQTQLAQLLGLTQGGTSAAGTGAAAGTQGINQATGLYDIANTGASNLTAGNQADLTNQLQQNQFDINNPFAALNNYYNIVGNKAWGSTSNGTNNSTTTTTPSLLSDIGAGVGTIGSLMGLPTGGGSLGSLFSMGGNAIKGIGQ